MTAPPAKDGKAMPVKARPTAEHASTRKVSTGNKTGNTGALPQTRDLISDADEFAEYNGTAQSFAGYSYKKNEEKYYNSSTKHEDDKKDSSEENDNKESRKKEQTSSDEPDYKDEIEKEAVEQERKADQKAEQDGRHNDDNDEDDDEDEEDEDDEDEQNDDDEDEDDFKEEGHSENASTTQKDDIYNPAEQSFAVSPTVLPGMCPPCRE